ncbi:MAG: tryptophan-rich sensory protein [Oxalobacteraceae bacterium]|nr:tryptophan-rich sensory protein [Oxalobacteraceae bacterium]
MRSETAAKNVAVLFSLFALIVVLSAALIGNMATIPNIPVWYAGLAKPSFNPPNWIFGPVWSTLYAMMVLSFWRVLLRDAPLAAIAVFIAQMVLNAFWSVAFFAMHDIALALGVVLLLEALILLTIFLFARIDRLAAWLLAPYALWVGFASILNAAILSLN